MPAPGRLRVLGRDSLIVVEGLCTGPRAAPARSRLLATEGARAMDGVRKTYEIVEEVSIEGGTPVEPPSIIAAVLAVIENPLARRWADDLNPLIEMYSEELGRMLGGRCAELLGKPAEAFGKGALVGLDGEIEHGSAIIHN